MAVRVLTRNIAHFKRHFKSVRRSLSSSQHERSLTASYWHEPGVEPLTPRTIGQLVHDAAEQWGDREAVVSLHQGERLSFMQCKQEADKLAAGFKEIGLLPGDRLGIWGPNSTQWYITNLAAARAGLISVNINPAFQAGELLTCMNQVGIKALVAGDKYKTQNYYDMIQSVVPELAGSTPGRLMSESVPSLKSAVIMSKQELPGSYRYEDVLHAASPGAVSRVQVEQQEIQPDHGCNIQFTSGTTGQAKGTLLSHHNMVNNSYVVGKNIGLNTKHHRICVNVPFFHCYGNVVSILCGLHFGSTLILPDAGFVPHKSLSAIQEERCTVLYGTPTMYYDLLAAVDVQGHLEGSEVEVAVNGGAQCSPQLFSSLMDTFRLNRVCSIYGMTETSPVSFQSLPSDTYELMTTTVGRVHQHLEVKVVDRAGRMVPMGSPGELMVRGYSIMLGYWNEEAKTRDIIGLDKWIRTGDLFILQENGYGQVVGRIKDIIIRGGENIFPKEIEQFLETHPNIREVQVFGIPDSRLGEEVAASLRLHEGRSLTEEEIKAYCKGKIAHYKIPRHIRIVPDFPKTVSGKIQKFRLREMLIQELQDKKRQPS